jgi:hypothetical protein
MDTITLEYDYSDVQTQKTLDYVLSLGLFKAAVNVKKEETISEKRKKLDKELRNYMVDLSDYKFNREEANIYE